MPIAAIHPSRGSFLKDPLRLPAGYPATVEPLFASAWSSGKQNAYRSAGPLLMAVGAFCVCLTHALVASANTERAEAIGYLCFIIVLLGCAASFISCAWTSSGTLRIRWTLMGAGALASAMGYAPSFLELFWGTETFRLFQTISFTASEALFLLASVLFFSGVTRFIVVVDTLQALLFILLRFNLDYSSTTQDHFANHHLLVRQLVSLVLFLVPMVACLGAASRSELRFLRTLVWFFGLRFVTFFLSNLVSYVWLHYRNSSLWDVPGTTLMAGFALGLFFTRASARTNAAESAQILRPSETVRSLMPSLLALINLLLGLLLLRSSMHLAAASIALSVVFYVVHMVLLHAQTVRENAFLQSRNEQLEGLARRDHLTGIGNRRSLAGVFHELQAGQGGRKLALLLLDIDHFKQANDRHGHLFGDKVLIALARSMEKMAAGIVGSHCARFGGDEFAVLLPEASAQDAEALAEKLRAEFALRVQKIEKSSVSLSIGIASLAAARDLPLEIFILRADEALYRAKTLGRNRIEIELPRDIRSEQGSPA